MKKTIRQLAVPLFIFFVMTSVTSCSAEKWTDSISGSSSADVGKVEAPVTIVWKPQVGPWPQDPDSPITKEIEKKFNVKLNYIYLERNNEAQMLNLRISSGQIPDVMYLWNSSIFSQLLDDGVLTEIPRDTFLKFAPQLYSMTEKTGGKNVFEYFSIDGRLYGIPQVLSDGIYHEIPVWRDDWLRNVGINKIPETVAEAEAAFYKFVREDPDRNNKDDTYALSDKGMSAIFGAYGAIPTGFGPQYDVFNWSVREGKVIQAAVLPEMREALALLNKWYEEGLIDPEFISGENKGQYWANTVTFWNGKIGFSVPGTYYHTNPPLFQGDMGSIHYQQFKKLQGKNATYKEGRALKGPTGKRGITKWQSVTGASLVFSKNVELQPKKMEKALQMLEAYHTDEDFYKMCKYGFEGKTYQMIDGIPKLLEGPAKDGTYEKMGAYVNGIIQIQNNHEMMRKLTMHPKLIDYATKYAATDIDGWTNEVYASLPSYSQYRIGLVKKIQENYILFITGQRSLKEWDRFVDEMNREGLKQLTIEANEWYNKYNN